MKDFRMRNVVIGLMLLLLIGGSLAAVATPPPGGAYDLITLFYPGPNPPPYPPSTIWYDEQSYTFTVTRCGADTWAGDPDTTGRRLKLYVWVSYYNSLSEPVEQELDVTTWDTTAGAGQTVAWSKPTIEFGTWDIRERSDRITAVRVRLEAWREKKFLVSTNWEYETEIQEVFLFPPL